MCEIEENQGFCGIGMVGSLGGSGPLEGADPLYNLAECACFPFCCCVSRV